LFALVVTHHQGGAVAAAATHWRQGMYVIVEITREGRETFLVGFEDVGEAWDAASRLRCEARRRCRKVRHEVR
jgi:hypothetical protein